MFDYFFFENHTEEKYIALRFILQARDVKKKYGEKSGLKSRRKYSIIHKIITIEQTRIKFCI